MNDHVVFIFSFVDEVHHIDWFVYADLCMLNSPCDRDFQSHRKAMPKNAQTTT